MIPPGACQIDRAIGHIRIAGKITFREPETFGLGQVMGRRSHITDVSAVRHGADLATMKHRVATAEDNTLRAQGAEEYGGW